MIHTKIKSLLTEHKTLSISQLVKKTGFDKIIVEEALKTWIKKGKVSEFEAHNPCKHCLTTCVSNSCAEEETLYIWNANQT
jgi:hypothetical protein